MKTVIFLIVGILLCASVAFSATLQWDKYDDQASIKGFVLYSQEKGTEDKRSIVLNDPALETYVLDPTRYVPGKTYEMWLTAYNDAGESEKSNVVEWTPPVFRPVENPPDIVIHLPGPINNLKIHISTD